MKRQGQAIKRLQKDNTFAFAEASKQRERANRVEETLFALVNRTTRIIDHELEKKQLEKRRELGFRVLKIYLEEALPAWLKNPNRDPRGIAYDRIAERFPEHKPDSIGRRMREWKQPHKGSKCKGNCAYEIYGFETPPIKGTGGFYLPNSTEIIAK